jgi:hypothetical protein
MGAPFPMSDVGLHINELQVSPGSSDSLQFPKTSSIRGGDISGHHNRRAMCDENAHPFMIALSNAVFLFSCITDSPCLTSGFPVQGRKSYSLVELCGPVGG